MSSDFLERMGARAIGAANLVRPAVASLFEPRSLTGARRRVSDRPESSDVREARAIEAPPAARSDRRDALPRGDPRAAVAAIPPARAIDWPEPPRGEDRDRGGPPRAVISESERARSPQRPATVAVVAKAVPTETDAATPRARRGAASFRGDEPREVRPAPAPLGREPPPREAALRARSGAGETIQPRRDEHGGHRPSELAQRARRVRAPREDEPAAKTRVPIERPLDGEAGREPAESEDAPIVRITIGRIEVRAVPAPVRPPPASPREVAGSGTSLADYLARNEAGRP